MQLGLGITQQVALVPVYLHFSSSELLSAWLALYAAGNLVLAADAGVHSRAMNRFLAFRSCVDSDGRTARYYGAMLQIYLLATCLLSALLVSAMAVLWPSRILGFQAAAGFDAAFIVMGVGMLLTLPSNLAAGLYRARGLYGRAVWIPCAAQVIAQIGQIAAIVATGDLLTIAIAYVAPQILLAAYFVAIDAPRCFPFLRLTDGRPRWSARWAVGQIRRAFPFAVAGGTDMALQNLSVLLVSALVADRVLVAQWGVTRVVAGLLRALCTQVTLPLAAELGHDYSVGAKERLRLLYARGSVFVGLLASIVVSGLLAFWPDFFVLWTNNAIPYDSYLVLTLLIGTALGAPAVLALGYAYCSNRGALLARSKALQLVVFLVVSVALTPLLGPLGMAVSIVASDLLVQSGWLGLTIIRQTLQRPLRHVLFLMVACAVVIPGGWALGVLIRTFSPFGGLAHFVAECALWLAIAALACLPLTVDRSRRRLEAIIPD